MGTQVKVQTRQDRIKKLVYICASIRSGALSEVWQPLRVLTSIWPMKTAIIQECFVAIFTVEFEKQPYQKNQTKFFTVK